MLRLPLTPPLRSGVYCERNVPDTRDFRAYNSMSDFDALIQVVVLRARCRRHERDANKSSIPI